ncbi:MAG: STAS domain-containing protein [Actinomycetota bacterium]|nr:STAS domain-containing protein [Actinomycetota bacterium]
MPQTAGLPSSSPYPAEAAPPGFQCACSPGGSGSVRVRVAGELDLSTAPLLEQTLRRAERRARLIVLDLRELTFMDSAGLHVIVNASIRASQSRRRLVLVRGPSQVDRLFTMTGAADVLEISDLDTVEAPVQVPAQLAREDHAA